MLNDDTAQPSISEPKTSSPMIRGNTAARLPNAFLGEGNGLHEPKAKALPQDMVVSSPRYGENTAFFSSFPLVDGWGMLSAIPSELHESANHSLWRRQGKKKGRPRGLANAGTPCPASGGSDAERLCLPGRTEYGANLMTNHLAHGFAARSQIGAGIEGFRVLRKEGSDGGGDGHPYQC